MGSVGTVKVAVIHLCSGDLTMWEEVMVSLGSSVEVVMETGSKLS